MDSASSSRPVNARLRADGISAVASTAIVAALHIMVLATRVPGKHAPRPMTLLTWQAPARAPEAALAAEDPPSNPVQNYSVGQLALAVGMAVMTLTRWLHVMRVSGSRTF